MKNVVVSVVVVLVLCSLVGPGLAQTSIGFNAVGPKLGFVMPEGDIESTIGFGLESDLGTITPQIHLGAFLEYWRKSYDAAYYGWTWSSLGIGATANYLLPKRGKLGPYVGGGLGLYRAKGEWEYTGPTGPLHERSHSDSNTDLGIHLLAGVDYEVGPRMKAVAEFRYALSDPDYAAFWGGILYALK